MLKQAAEPSEIGQEFIIAAVRLWNEYFWPHARASLRQVGLSDRHRDTRKALRWVRAHGKGEVSREELRREALSQKLDAQQTDLLIEALVRAGWLRRKTEMTPGRARHRWQVNPELTK
jgi:hypothetical protein